MNVRYCLFNTQGGWYTGPTVTPQLHITETRSLLSVQRRICRHFDWLNLNLFVNSTLKLGAGKVWKACIFQNPFACCGLAKRRWQALGEVCWGSGPVSCLTLDNQHSGLGWSYPVLEDAVGCVDRKISDKELQGLSWFPRKRLNWPPMNPVDAEVRITVWTSFCSTPWKGYSTMHLYPIYIHSTFAWRTYSIFYHSAECLPFWKFSWPHNQEF